MDLNQDFEEYSEESSDDDCGGQLDRILVPKLPVASFDTYDPSLPPVSGEEYLRRVQLEAQKCPEVVVADLDLSKFKSNQTLLIENTNGFIRAKAEVMPSQDWQREQVSEFSKVRLKLCKLRDNRLSTTSDRPFVSNRSMNWWREFCIAKKTDSSSDSECEESDLSTPTDTPNSGSTLECEKRVKPKPNMPLVNTICAMTQEEVIRLLSYFTKWIQQFGFNDHKGVWIYALLVALEKPLPAEVYSTLRDLSRVCSQCRHRIQSPEESQTLVNSMNLIICLIGRYFDQNDMCDQ